MFTHLRSCTFASARPVDVSAVLKKIWKNLEPITVIGPVVGTCPAFVRFPAPGQTCHILLPLVYWGLTSITVTNAKELPTYFRPLRRRRLQSRSGGGCYTEPIERGVYVKRSTRAHAQWVPNCPREEKGEEGSTVGDRTSLHRHCQER